MTDAWPIETKDLTQIFMPPVTSNESTVAGKKQTRSFAMERWFQTAFLLFMTGVCALYALNWRSPNFGLYHDDGIYLVTARALAEGDGYRITSLPNDLVQAKYPPVFPALLAAVWKAWPTFPDNLPLLKAVPILCGFLWGVCGFFLLRKMVPEQAARWIAGLSLASSMVITAFCSLLPDSFFALMTTLSLLLLMRNEPYGKMRMRDVALSAICLGAGLLARTMGLAFVIATLAMLAWRRRLREAVVFGMICFLLYLPWMLWVKAHPSPDDPVYFGYSPASYRGGHILSSVYSNPERVRMAVINLTVMLTGATLLLPLDAAGPVGILLAVTITAAAIYGFWLTARERLTMVHAWVTTFLGLLIIWAWPPLRYLIPVQLPVLAFAFLGAHQVMGRLFANGRRMAWAGVLTIFLVCAALQGAHTMAAMKDYGYPARRGVAAASWSDIEEASLWIRSLTPRDAVITANTEIIFHLLTDRKAIRGFYYDAYDIFYAEASGAEHELTPERTATMLRDHLKANNITHLVVMPLNQFLEDGFFRGAAFQLEQQGILKLRRGDPARGVFLYEVDSSKLS